MTEPTPALLFNVFSHETHASPGSDVPSWATRCSNERVSIENTVERLEFDGTCLRKEIGRSEVCYDTPCKLPSNQEGTDKRNDRGE